MSCGLPNPWVHFTEMFWELYSVISVEEFPNLFLNEFRNVFVCNGGKMSLSQCTCRAGCAQRHVPTLPPWCSPRLRPSPPPVFALPAFSSSCIFVSSFFDHIVNHGPAPSELTSMIFLPSFTTPPPRCFSFCYVKLSQRTGL